jgi:hypothetical protein
VKKGSNMTVYRSGKRGAVVYNNLYEDLLDLTAINYNTSGSSELNNRNISVEDWYWVLWKVERRSTRD